jgi:2-keto-4-pentenoate hydratase/2-oxohepta-3-ene-1,7-dioic acid hydratase in catechol pathway
VKIARFVDPERNERHGIVQANRVWVLENPRPGGIEDWLKQSGNILGEIGAPSARSFALSEVRLLAPIRRPPKFLALGGNYASHLKEIEHLGIKFPEVQIWTNKQSTCISGPVDDVIIPAQSNQVDYEGELAVVIGRRCRHVPAERAHEVIAGYLVCNDVSVRDVQLRSVTMTLGKSFDTHGPIGPWLVTADEIANPHDLSIRTWVNGELRQDGRTNEMRYSIFDQIAELTSIFALEPGDILATGTPAGIAAAMRPPRYLQPNDRVRVEIERIGALDNRCLTETPRTDIE